MQSEGCTANSARLSVRMISPFQNTCLQSRSPIGLESYPAVLIDSKQQAQLGITVLSLARHPPSYLRMPALEPTLQRNANCSSRT